MTTVDDELNTMIEGLLNPNNFDEEYEAENAFRVWVECRQNWKLLGGTGDLTSSTKTALPPPPKFPFDELKHLCKSIVQDAMGIRQKSMAMKEILIAKGVIKPETTYVNLKENHMLMSHLFDAISLGLEEDPSKCSLYGLGLVSDFDLIWNLKEDIKFNTKMKQLCIAVGSIQYTTLYNKRRSLRRYVTKIRDFVIDSFELPETPDRTTERETKKKRAKADVTKEEAEKIASEKLEQAVEVANEKTKKKKSSSSEIATTDSGTKQMNPTYRFLGQRSYRHKKYFDEFATPFHIIDPLLDFLSLNPATVIWEPCCGRLRNISKCIEKRNITVISSDIQEGFGSFACNFLQYDCNTGYDMIITNPPWSSNKEFLNRLITNKKPFAVLLKVEVIGTKYFKESILHCDHDFITYALPVRKGIFINPISNSSIQIGNVFWLIGGYIPHKYNEDLKLFTQLSIRTCASVFVPFIKENHDLDESVVDGIEIEDDDEDNFLLTCSIDKLKFVDKNIFIKADDVSNMNDDEEDDFEEEEEDADNEDTNELSIQLK